jgi:hypothetical protein
MVPSVPSDSSPSRTLLLQSAQESQGQIHGLTVRSKLPVKNLPMQNNSEKKAVMIVLLRLHRFAKRIVCVWWPGVHRT